MKKIFIIITLLFLTTGCKINGFETSDFKIKNGKLVGHLKNTNDTCKIHRITITLKNGSLNEKGYALVYKEVKKNETISINNYIYGTGFIITDDIDDYDVTINNIECE